jgi:hypothetical protein
MERELRRLLETHGGLACVVGEMGGGWERRRGQGERSGGVWEGLCGFGLFARRLF